MHPPLLRSGARAKKTLNSAIRNSNRSRLKIPLGNCMASTYRNSQSTLPDTSVRTYKAKLAGNSICYLLVGVEICQYDFLRRRERLVPQDDLHGAATLFNQRWFEFHLAHGQECRI